MMTYSEILFYVVFAGQIALLSIYFPKKISARMRYVLDKFPPAEYPKMYPLPEYRYHTGQVLYRWSNHCLAVLGLIILASVMFVVDHLTFADDGEISEAWPAGYAMLQFLPILALEFSGLSQYRKMRATATRKRADLTPRKLTQLVPAWLLWLAAAAFALAVYSDYYANSYVLEWDKALSFGFGNLFMIGVAAWSVFGRKQDPHQAAADRARASSAVLHSMAYVSIAMSLFYMSTAADQIFQLDSFDAVLMSLYFQVVGWLSVGTMLRSVRLEDLNFDVYKAHGDVT